MKLLKFSDNVATIGGKRVPYSLLGAAAAILGALLIWMQFRHSGGLTLGGQSPDLSGLVDSSVGGVGGGTGAGGGTALDLGSSGTYLPPGVGVGGNIYGPVPTTPLPFVYGPTTSYAAIQPGQIDGGGVSAVDLSTAFASVASAAQVASSALSGVLGVAPRSSGTLSPAATTTAAQAAQTASVAVRRAIAPPPAPLPAPTVPQYTGGSAFGKNPG